LATDPGPGLATARRWLALLDRVLRDPDTAAHPDWSVSDFHQKILKTKKQMFLGRRRLSN
jgi:hypothetical protein